LRALGVREGQRFLYVAEALAPHALARRCMLTALFQRSPPPQGAPREPALAVAELGGWNARALGDEVLGPVALRMDVVERLSEALRPDERVLLVAVAENIPQREIAEWLGVSYAVARKRLERLRARLTEVAMHYANTLEPDDARELQRFFHRCRARIGARTIGVGTSGSAARAAPASALPRETEPSPRHPRIRS